MSKSATSDNEGMTVLVTGATRGIGRAIASEFGRRGARVLVHGRSAESAGQATDQLREQAFDVHAVHGDLRDAGEIEELISMVGNCCDRLDVLVNNAGQLVSGPLRRAQRAQWQQMFDIHVVGPLQICQGLFPLLRKSKSGSIVNIGSMAGERPVPGRAAYSAAKAALLNLTMSLAQEWAPYKIRANAVLPGAIDTEFLRENLPTEEAAEHVIREIGLKRLGRAEEVAEVVCFLASPQASYCTGSAFSVHGGQH